ncbi:MAG: Fe-S cluster assembly ATPase SufC [bacterium]
MIEIKNLHVRTEGGAEILKGLDLHIPAGQVHAIMGPNGSGKSTLSYVLAGRDGYEVTAGSVLFKGQDLLAMAPEERAHAGIFLGLQYPVEIPGVSNAYFLRTAVNAVRVARGQPALDAVAFMAEMRRAAKVVELSTEMLKRDVNVGFSGGEKKRNEILQLGLLDPEFAILDETDSGLDIDALSVVARGINAHRGPGRSFLVITHYQRLLDHVRPDVVHVLQGGRIVKSGGPELALELEARGYGWVTEQGA